jgi:KRAB domain-containing zinc finger protein
MAHAKTNNFSCDVCRRVFTRKRQLNVHRLTHAGPNDFSCDQCSKVFFSEVNLKFHKQNYHREKKYGCNVCGKTFSSRSEMKSHQQSHTGFTCAVCHKVFTRQNRLFTAFLFQAACFSLFRLPINISVHL